MAKITIAGNAVVITSELKLADLKNIEKYRPKALVLKGGEEGKEEIFRIATTESAAGSLNQYGAAFGAESHGEDKKAVITMFMNNIPSDKSIAEVVADELGCAITNLNALEKTLPAVSAEIAAERKAVVESISVAQ